MVGRYAVEINGINAVVLTKIDVLDQFETLKVCTGYTYKGQAVDGMPANMEVLEHVEPVYTEYPGWKQSTSGVTSFDDLPENARRYIDALQEHLGVPFLLISTGPDRDHTILQGELFPA